MKMSDGFLIFTAVVSIYAFALAGCSQTTDGGSSGSNTDTGAVSNDDTKALVSGITITAAGGVSYVTNGKTLQLTAAVTPDNAADKTVAWSSSDETSATVDSTGLVTAKAVTAKVTITATAKDGSGVKGTIDLAVTAAAAAETVAEKTMKAYGIMFTPSTGAGGAWINLTAEWNDAANAITESGLITDNMTIDSITYTGPVGVATAGTMTQKWGLGFNAAGFTATGSHVLNFEISWKSSLYKVAVTFDGKNDTSDSPFNVTDETITEVTQAEQVAAEKVVLKAAIDSAQTEHDNATEGTAAGNYNTGSKATFQAAIDAATAVYNDTAATVATVKQAETDLASAEKTFKASVVVPSTVPDWTSSIHCNDNGAWFFYMLTWKDDSDAVAIADMDLTTNKPAITGGFTAGYSNAVDVSSVNTATKTAKWGMGINGAGYHTKTPCTLTCYIVHSNVTYKVETVFTDDAADHTVGHDMTIVSTTVTAVQ